MCCFLCSVFGVMRVMPSIEAPFMMAEKSVRAQECVCVCVCVCVCEGLHMIGMWRAQACGLDEGRQTRSC